MAKRTNDFAPYLFMAGIVAIVAVVGVLLNGSMSLQGAPVYQVKTGEYQGSCTDNDPGNDYYTLGKTTFGPYEYLDYCLDDTSVVQFQCSSSQDVSPTVPYECPYGCHNGYCLREAIS